MEGKPFAIFVSNDLILLTGLTHGHLELLHSRPQQAIMVMLMRMVDLIWFKFKLH